MRLLLKCAMLALIGFSMFVLFQAVSTLEALPDSEQGHSFGVEDAYQYALAEKRFEDCNVVTRWLLSAAVGIEISPRTT